MHKVLNKKTSKRPRFPIKKKWPEKIQIINHVLSVYTHNRTRIQRNPNFKIKNFFNYWNQNHQKLLFNDKEVMR